MFALLAYTNPSVGVNAVNTDLSAIDPEWTRFNNHYIFTDPVKLLGAYLHGASVTRGRFQSPKWNAFGEFDVFAANRSASTPPNPIFDNWRQSPLDIPNNEEIQLQVSGNLGTATESDTGFIWIGSPDWRMTPDTSGPFSHMTQFSFTATPIANNWSGGQTLTFAQKPLGGVWAVNGMVLQGANADAFRVIFPRSRMYSGRRPRPGNIIQTAIGDIPMIQDRVHPFGWGVWGYYHTFEPFTVEVFGVAAVSSTYTGYVWQTYLGGDQSILTQKIQSAY